MLFRLIRNLNHIRTLINLGLRPRLNKLFLGNLNHIETSKHCLINISNKGQLNLMSLDIRQTTAIQNNLI